MVVATQVSKKKNGQEGLVLVSFSEHEYTGKYTYKYICVCVTNVHTVNVLVGCVLLEKGKWSKCFHAKVG